MSDDVNNRRDRQKDRQSERASDRGNAHSSVRVGVISGASERETGPFYGAAAEVGPRS